MNATQGTKTAVWLNLLAGLATLIASWATPDTIIALAGSKAAGYATGISLLLNYFLHAFTGTTTTGSLPGVLPPPDIAKGSI